MIKDMVGAAEEEEDVAPAAEEKDDGCGGGGIKTQQLQRMRMMIEAVLRKTAAADSGRKGSIRRGG